MFRILQLIILLFILICPNANALVSGVTEEDGSPSVFPWQIKFANGTLTDNGDGTVSHTQAGAGGGDNVNVNGGATVDPDFQDSSELNVTNSSNVVTYALVASSIDETKLDASTNASLDLADSALQSETNDLESVATSAGDAEVFVGTGVGTGAYITGLTACAADEKIEYVPGTPDTFTCEAIGSLVEADITDLTHTTDTTLNLAGVETITGNWVNTTNPWADNEVADDITASSYLPLAGGTMTGSLVTDNLGIEFEDSDTNPTCGAGEYKIYADLSETTFKKCMNGSATDLDTGGGSSEWTDTGTVVHPTETGDDVALGNTTLINSAKLSIDGDADQVQFSIQGNATQTSNLVTLEQSDGTDVFTITDAGVTTIGASGAGNIDLGTNTITDDILGNTLVDWMNLPVQSAKITGTHITTGATIDAGDGNWRLLFSGGATDEALWQFRMPNTYGSAPVAKLGYSMSAGCSSTKVDLEVKMMAVTDGDSADIGTGSFDTLNEITGGTSCPATAGYLDEISISFANADSVAAGDLVLVHVQRDHDDADDTETTADLELVYLQLEWNR